jgi:ABC-2 type transport system permease protein
MTWANEIEKIYYFMKRDIISFSTYKMNMLLLIGTAIFGALAFAFLGTSATNDWVEQTYHMNYTTYLLIGLAFSTYLNQSLTLVQKTINPWTLEEVLVSPTRLSTFIIGSSLWSFIWSTGVVVIYLGIGVLAFGVVLNINILSTAIVIALGIATFLGFSMVGAGVLILTKQGDPVTSVITLATSLFGNVLFPIVVMPLWMQTISYIVPQYYFFTSIRYTLNGSTILEILPQVTILAIMCAIVVPVGYYVYSWSLKTAKKNGTINWF